MNSQKVFPLATSSSLWHMQDSWLPSLRLAPPSFLITYHSANKYGKKHTKIFKLLFYCFRIIFFPITQFLHLTIDHFYEKEEQSKKQFKNNYKIKYFIHFLITKVKILRWISRKSTSLMHKVLILFSTF